MSDTLTIGVDHGYAAMKSAHWDCRLSRGRVPSEIILFCRES